VPVVIGTHPIPLKYLENHEKLSFWKKSNMSKIAEHMFNEDKAIMTAYN
jgi:hypothetical protein